MSAQHTPGRILIDCRDCGGAGCQKCRNKGTRTVTLMRPEGIRMPRAEEAFEAAREACPCYQGCSINAGVAQCTHADHDDGEWCEPRSCPVAIAKAQQGGEVVSPEDIKYWLSQGRSVFATESAAPSDAELAAAAYKGYDDYWTKDCAGKESESWLASAKAVLACSQTARPHFDLSEQEHAAKCPARDGYPCCCSSAPEAMPWNWLRGVINALPSTPSGYRELIARHDVLAWIDEGERLAIAKATGSAS